jgi:hypothetical protein
MPTKQDTSEQNETKDEEEQEETSSSSLVIRQETLLLGDDDDGVESSVYIVHKTMKVERTNIVSLVSSRLLFASC